MRTLTPADVVPIPTGTAVGALFSGNYLVTSGAIAACRCRIGSCSTLHVIVGDTLSALQSDGALQITFESTQDVVSGGIDADGTFRCDGMTSANVGYGLVNGQFHAVGTTPVNVTYVTEATLSSPTLDCDIRGTSTAEYTGPIAAPFTGPTAASVSGAFGVAP